MATLTTFNPGPITIAPDGLQLDYTGAPSAFTAVAFDFVSADGSRVVLNGSGIGFLPFPALVFVGSITSFFVDVGFDGSIDYQVDGLPNLSLTQMLSSPATFHGLAFAGADVLTAGGGNDYVDGGEGADRIVGGAGDDTLLGSNGSDRVNGGSGNDRIFWDNGIDTLDGDEGFDVLDLTRTFVSSTIDLGTGLTHVVGARMFDFEGVNGGNQSDRFTGDGSNEQLVGAGGNDTLIGNSGNDTLIGGFGDDSMSGGSGDDSVLGGVGFDVADGGTGVDTLNLTAFGGAYVVNLSDGSTNFGGESFLNFENLITGAGADVHNGSSAANRLTTGDGADFAFGFGGNDTLDGQGGWDWLEGGEGDDRLLWNNGVDTLDGGAGFDTLDLTGLVVGAAVSLGAGTTHVAGALALNFEAIEGGALGDAFTGDASSERLSGNGGGDRLTGGDGADTLVGGAGVDTLIGGTGLDVFVFQLASHSTSGAADILRAGGGGSAFSAPGAALGDRIDVSAIDASTAAGVQDFVFGTATGVGRLRAANDAASSDTLILGNTDSDATSEFVLRIEDGAVLASAYTAADFVV
jgi:Ca2+-binding RTX toxin-like protein